jgi:hypothetical protein
VNSLWRKADDCVVERRKQYHVPSWTQWKSTMHRENNSLEDEVIAVFERACREQNLVAAEYLLQTLEAMTHRSGNGERLEDAYLHLAQITSGHPRAH